MTPITDPVILIADDETDIRAMLRIMLERDGYVVEEARNGEEAVEACQRHMPDIVLMDILMPIMDGAAACERVQAMPGGDQVPVLMVTALNDKQSIDRCFDAGATDYITKPINHQVLRRRLRRLLRTRQAEAELRASEARLASIIATATDAIVLTDADGRIRLFNPAAERIFGYAATEMTDQLIDLLLLLQLHQLTDRPTPPGEYLQCRGQRKDGTEFPAEVALGQFEQNQSTMLTVTLRDITRRKQAEAEVERRVQQLASLAQIGQAVTTRLEQNEVLQTVIDQVMLRLQAEGVSVLLRESSTELIFAAVNGASADRLRGTRIPLQAGIAGEVLRTGHAVRIRSADDRSRIYRQVEQVSQYHALDMVAVPLKLGNEILGVMEAVHSQTFVFNDDDMRLLESAASWAAIAIGNARQHQRLQRRLRESEALAAIGRALNETLDLDQVLQLIVTSARQMIPQASTAALLLFDETRNLAYAVTEQGRAERQPNEEGHLGWQAHPFGSMLEQGQVINVGDRQQAGEPWLTGADPEMQSFLAAPVRGSAHHFGAISLQSHQTRAFDTDDERLLAMLGVEAAIAIQNAQLYQSEHTQRELAEALRDTAATITGSLDLDDVLDRILDNVGRVVPHDAANIMLAESGVARLARWRGYDRSASDQLRARRFSIADTLQLRQMSESHLPLVIVDTREFAGWVALPGSRAVQSFIGAPIRFKRQLLGFINLESVTAGFFEPAYADRLQIFADQAAIAIENARLYQLEQEQLQHWQQSQAVALQADKMDALGRLASSLTSAVEDPLRQMQDALQLAMDNERDPEQRASDLQNLSKAIERLNQITRSMNSFAQPVPEPSRAVPLIELIQQSLSMARELLEQRHIQLTTDLQATPDVITAPRQMTQALYSLIENAIEAVRERGQIHIATQADGGSVAVMIIDDGPAISPTVMPHIFEPFYTTKPGGTGLGLAISHNVIQQQGGTLTVSNVSNERGVMFTVRLPLAQSG